MTASLMIPPKARFFNQSGTAPLVGGKVWTYAAGTDTLKTSYTNFYANVANTNPVILDAYGQADIWLSGNYKIKLTDANNIVQWTVDNVSSTSGSGAENFVITTGSPNAYIATPTPPIQAYELGMTYWVEVNFTNTGPATINFSNIGAVNITDNEGNLLVGGELQLGLIYNFVYDGTNWRVLTPSASDNSYPTAGTASAYTLTPTPAATAYVAGLTYIITMNVANASGATINVSGLGVKNLVTPASKLIVSGQLQSGGIYTIIYDGTNFQVFNPSIDYTARYYNTTGAGNAYVLTPNPVLQAYAAGDRFLIRPNFTNSGAATINISGLGTQALVLPVATALTGGEMVQNVIYTIVYDGTNFQVLGTNTFSGGVISSSVITDSLINEKHGANIASASTINLTNATGNFIHVTGTTTITAVTLADGYERVVVFDGILTLTNGANLVLPGAANITTAAGDIAVFRGDSTGVVRVTQYERASSPVTTLNVGVGANQLVQFNGSTQYPAADGSLITNISPSAGSGMARAWVNYNGTGTIAIRDSLNVSSLTDNGTGDQTINLSITMANSNYSFAGGGFYTGGSNNVICIGMDNVSAMTTTSLRINTVGIGTTNCALFDAEYATLAIFGDV